MIESDQTSSTVIARAATEIRWVALALVSMALVLVSVASVLFWIQSERAIRETSEARYLLDDSRYQVDGSRRQLDDARRQIDELNKTLRLATGIENGPKEPLTPAGPVVMIADLLTQAEQLRTDGSLREAEIILTRAVQSDPDHVDAWRALAKVQRDTSAASVKAGNLLSAAQEVDRARSSVNSIKGISVAPVATLEPKVVLEEENLTNKMATIVRDAIDKSCKAWIVNARQCESDAFHSSWNVLALGLRRVRNDRDEVVKGLTYLKQVFEVGPWASETTRTSASVVYGNLKKLVNPEEWNELLVRAGFDPSCRDALKKSGLE